LLATLCLLYVHGKQLLAARTFRNGNGVIQKSVGAEPVEALSFFENEPK
jgi:hypothetical protein